MRAVSSRASFHCRRCGHVRRRRAHTFIMVRASRTCSDTRAFLSLAYMCASVSNPSTRFEISRYRSAAKACCGRKPRHEFEVSRGPCKSRFVSRLLIRESKTRIHESVTRDSFSSRVLSLSLSLSLRGFRVRPLIAASIKASRSLYITITMYKIGRGRVRHGGIVSRRV